MDHKELQVWKQSMDLVVMVYDLTRAFPDEERYGLISQMRRAAVSIPSNIAEGAARKSDNEFLQFLSVCLGSLAELETQYLIAVRLHITTADTPMETSLVAVKKLLLGFRNYLRSKKSSE
ncbi:four helix bundle protein [Bizionia sp. KMM 8389]